MNQLVICLGLIMTIFHYSVTDSEELKSDEELKTDDELIYCFRDKFKHPNYDNLYVSSVNTAINKTGYDSSRKSLFVFHGEGTKDDQYDTIVQIANAVFKYHDVNIFSVNWRYVSHKPFEKVIASVPYIGRRVAYFIRILKKHHCLLSSELIFVGYSMSAHVAGYTGRYLNGDVETIVGLDPYRWNTSIYGDYTSLAIGDARYVQIIHTNGRSDGYGFIESVGNSDYFVNGGEQQPGCTTNVCHHTRANYYYGESLTTDRFVARRSENYDQFKEGVWHRPFSSMGMLMVDRNASGRYYLDTNNKAPFAKG